MLKFGAETYQHYALFDFRPVFRSIHFQFAAKGFSRFWILSSYNLVFLGSAYELLGLEEMLVSGVDFAINLERSRVEIA